MKPYLLAGALLLTASPALAKDWKKIISEDLVTVTDGKMTMESFELCKLGPPSGQRTSLQLRHYAEAPVGAGISQDFLVSFTSVMQTMIIMAFAQATSGGAFNFDNLDCHDTDAPIGAVDLDISFFLTGEGYQVALKNNNDGTTDRTSERWADTFKDE